MDWTVDSEQLDYKSTARAVLKRDPLNMGVSGEVLAWILVRLLNPYDSHHHHLMIETLNNHKPVSLSAPAAFL